MARLSKHHEELNENGEGKCSVPMWSNGMPAGFCDEVAHGKQEPGQRRYGEWSPAWRKWFAGYCSGTNHFHELDLWTRETLEHHVQEFWRVIYQVALSREKVREGKEEGE